MERREFLVKCGMGLAGIIAAGKAPAAIVKSLVGANGTGFAGNANEWVNPYVTDGLVAMWDGEWNAGPGKHDPEATTWADISGGESLVIGGGTPVINDKSINNSIGAKAICYWKYQDGRAIALGETSYVVEVVCKININANNMVFRNGNYRFWNGYKSRILLGSGRSVTPSLTALLGVNSYTLDFIGCATYRNGELFTTSGRDSITFNFNSFILGSNRSDYFGCEIFCFRIYSRQLTTEEIAHNYAIDKERFGLP